MSIYRTSSIFKEDELGSYAEKDAEDTLPYTLDWYSFLRGNDLYWSPNIDVHVNQKFTPSQTKLNGHRYKVQSGGTAGNYEPQWPIGSGATVVDGTIVWQEIGVEDSIATSVWTTSPAGLSVVSTGSDSVNTQITLAGGTLGETYIVDNKITANSASVLIKSKRFRLIIKDQ